MRFGSDFRRIAALDPDVQRRNHIVIHYPVCDDDVGICIRGDAALDRRVRTATYCGPLHIIRGHTTDCAPRQIHQQVGSGCGQSDRSHWINGQNRIGTGHATHNVGHHHAIAASIGRLDIGQVQGRVGCVDQQCVGVKIPLITNWSQTRHRHAEVCVVALNH